MYHQPLANLLQCDERIEPLYHDVPIEQAEAIAVSAMVQGMTSFTSRVTRASWDSDDQRGHVAFVRTINDAAIPLATQQTMPDIIKDTESGYSPQVSQPKNLARILVELMEIFQTL